MSPEKKTLVGFKIRSDRKTVVELFALAKILIVLCLLIGLVGVAKVVACRSDHPGRPILKCLAPLRGDK